MKRRRLVAALSAAAALGVASAVAHALRAPPAALARAREGGVRTGEDGVQTAELTSAAGEYRPNVVHARAGAPLRLRVVVQDPSACATRLLVPDLGVDLALVAGGTAEIVLSPARAGSYVFTCGQRMVKGVLVLE